MPGPRTPSLSLIHYPIPLRVLGLQPRPTGTLTLQVPIFAHAPPLPDALWPGSAPGSSPSLGPTPLESLSPWPRPLLKLWPRPPSLPQARSSDRPRPLSSLDPEPCPSLPGPAESGLPFGCLRLRPGSGREGGRRRGRAGPKLQGVEPGGCLRCSDGVPAWPLGCRNMTPEEWQYLAILLISIPVGFLFKKAGPGLKQWGAAGVGVALTLLTCGPHILHSLVTVLGTWIIMETWPRSCHALALAWTFLYLLFFRMVTVLGLPAPTPFTNAVQLLLTLKLVSLASEVQELRAQKETDPQKRPAVGQLLAVPSLPQMLSYSYCYVGLLTGPFYRYRTFHDWVHQGPARVPSWEPLLLRARPAPLFGLLFLLSSWLFPLEAVREDAFYERPFAFRLFYMVPVFFAFRMRFYVAWIAAECDCIAAGFGAYPVGAKSRAGGGPTQPYPAPDSPEAGAATKYDYETIRNIDCQQTDFCVRVRDGMRYWNMTVQWWLAQYVYKSAPARSYVLRSAWTMLLSAYWHGIHPGYYLSFLTIPLCLAAEGCLESGLRSRLGPKAQQAWDWAHWFLKMRAYDYMCMGFVLLSLRDTLRYWASIYFCIHLLALGGLLLGLALGGGGPGRRGGGARSEAKTLPNKHPTPPDKLREE